MHGPSASAERIDVKTTRREKTDGRNFWKQQVYKIENQNKPKVPSLYF